MTIQAKVLRTNGTLENNARISSDVRREQHERPGELINDRRPEYDLALDHRTLRRTVSSTIHYSHTTTTALDAEGVVVTAVPAARTELPSDSGDLTLGRDTDVRADTVAAGQPTTTIFVDWAAQGTSSVRPRHGVVPDPIRCRTTARRLS
jgi:hypothetical protein